MAFDAGMLGAVVSEIKKSALGARIEKIFQPGKDVIVLQMRTFEGGKRLLINAGSANPRIGFTELPMENPQTPPMLCMLLRKHLNGSRLVDIRQLGFERVAVLEFEARDEMGFPCKKSLIAEIMGKYSNLIFTDESMKILSVLKAVDFTTSSKRRVLPGMRYELPPAQNKINPKEMDFSVFSAEFDRAYDSSREQHADKFIMNGFLGISAALAREIVYKATRHTDTPLEYCDSETLWEAFDNVINAIKAERFSPCIVIDTENGNKPVEYCFTALEQYGSNMGIKYFDSASAMLDTYFDTRDRDTRVHQRAADILRLLTNAESRIKRKIQLQKSELDDCERGEEYKKLGDLIVANLYMLEKGARNATLTDYSDYDADSGEYTKVSITLDERLTPSQNAQLLFKKYNKSKTARVELSRQIKIAESELEYIYSVFDALARAETVTDLAEIREELYNSGYASRMKTYTAHKSSAPHITKYQTSGGYTVLCGRNNVQNEYITHKLAAKNDYWFHAKNVPGSHTVLICHEHEGEPSERDFTEAAEIAALNSKAAGGQNIGVDYTPIKYIKKPPSAKPGFVIYHTYRTAYVTPNAEKIALMKV